MLKGQLKDFGHRLVYLLMRFAIATIGALPFKVLYLLSGFLAFSLHRLIRYRYSVVIGGLQRAFPDKNAQELQVIVERIYQNLADVFLESIKGFTMSKDELLKRHDIRDLDVVEKYIQQGKSLMIVIGHFNNWEWGGSVSALVFGGTTATVFQTLQNPYINNYLKNSRERFGTKFLTRRESIRYMLSNRRLPHIYVFAADQSPATSHKAHYVRFLNQLTACANGVDRLAHQLRLPILYIDVQRVQRGFYRWNIIELAENTHELPEGDCTRRFMEMLESRIKKNPESWLWTHKRWKTKHTRHAELSGISLELLEEKKVMIAD